MEPVSPRSSHGRHPYPPAKRNSETGHSNPAYRAENGVSDGVSDAGSVSAAEHEKPHRNGGVSDVSVKPEGDGEERQVFELAREYFGLGVKDGAA